MGLFGDFYKKLNSCLIQICTYLHYIQGRHVTVSNLKGDERMVYISRGYSDEGYYEDCRRKERKKEEMKNKKEEREHKCFVSTHELKKEHIKLEPNKPLVLFEDFTKNHNKTFIALSPDHDIQVIIKTRRKKEKEFDRHCDDRCNGHFDGHFDGHCERSIIKETIEKDSTKIFQVENFKCLIVTAKEFTLLDVDIQKTFCICCPNEEKRHEKHEKHHHCDCE